MAWSERTGEQWDRLIGAAPDMLAALEYCETWFAKFSPTAELINDLGHTEHPMLTTIRAAIAKAGDQS